MKTSLTFLILIILSINIVFGQEQESPALPVITTHSPNAASLGQYGEYPIDFSTGVPKIEIPLYTIKSGDLELPISLSYHASGIKVDQEASFVGLGWILNAGGVINRIIKDKLDDSNALPFPGFSTRGDDLPDYNSYTDDLPYGTIGNDPTYQDEDIRTNYKMDKEPDVYSISCSNLSGQFCLNNDLNYTSMNYEPYKYEVDINNKLIVITNEKGEVYRFGTSLSNEEAFESTGVGTSTRDEKNAPDWSGMLNDLPYDSSWHLTEIISANKQDTISFKYKTASYFNNKISSESRYVLADRSLVIVDDRGKNYDSHIQNYVASSINNVRVLDKILFKNGSIEFSSNTDRLDVGANYPRITSLTVFDLFGQQIEKIAFKNNDYFNRTGIGSTSFPSLIITDYKRKSLKLNAVEFYDKYNSFVKDYKFEYDLTPLPPVNTNSQDIWGYYNGQNNTTIIPETFYIDRSNKPVYAGGNRESDINYMKAGILNKVIFPTGGYTNFDYESNYYLSQEQLEGKKPTTKSISLAAINRSTSCPQEFFEGVPVNNTLEFTVTEELANNGVELGKLTIMFSDYDILNNGNYMTYRFTDLSPSEPVEYFFEHLPENKESNAVFTQYVSINQGHTYRLEAMTNGVTGSSMSICNSPWIESTLTYDYLLPATSQEIIPTQAGGLRINTITNYNSDNLPVTKKKYSYGDSFYGPNAIGVGTLITDPSKNFYYYPLLYYTYVAKFHDEVSEAALENTLWFISSSNIELGTNNGNPVDYNKVTEFTTSYLNNSLTNGKTEYYYSQTDRSVDMSWSTANRPYNRYIFPAWKKSNLQKTIQYKQKEDLSYEPVRSTEYTYTDFPEQRIKTVKVIEREPDKYRSSHYIPHDNNPNRFYYYNSYVSTGKRILNSEITKEYENGLETLAITKNYFYNNLAHIKPTGITSTNSKGDLLRTNIAYPQDIDAGVRTAAEQALISNHQLAVPIKTKTFKKEVGNPEELLSIQYTNFKDWDVDLGLSTNTNIILPENIQVSKGSGALDNRIEYHKYYDDGNVQEVSKTDGTHIVYLWGYNEEYPIAKIENATFSQVESAIATLHLNYDTLEEIQARSDLDNDRTIGTSGNEGALRTALNDLRNALPNAMLTTYTFDPLVGVTSITGSKGYTIYYEYDDANRLKMVKDADGKIVSENKYHYKSQ
ncbi:hypothetical protein [Wocania ichthyoenteri]|uniref:hypothetical protein n=1 Tax=Wocania ichthyoenteri TaxID=1230531 RepID=UPI00053F120C|nr:hypothetical protein [Wocania ichthyoenteri]